MSHDTNVNELKLRTPFWKCPKDLTLPTSLQYLSSLIPDNVDYVVFTYVYSQGRQATAHLVTTICLALLCAFAVTAWIAWFFLQEFWSLVDWLWPLPPQEILCSELPSLDCAIGLLSMQHKNNQQSCKIGNLCHTTKISRTVCAGFWRGLILSCWRKKAVVCSNYLLSESDLEGETDDRIEVNVFGKKQVRLSGWHP